MPDPEAEVIAEVTAAWERYLRLSIESRGKDPSPESLDFVTYVAGDAKSGLLQAIADGQAAGTYVDGEIQSLDRRVARREDGAWIVDDCAGVALTENRLDTSQVVEREVQEVAMRGRLEPLGTVLAVLAFEIGGRCADQ